MIKQAKIIKEFCDKEGFNFVDCDKENKRVPCALDKNYVENNNTFFIKGFYKGSMRIQTSSGGLKTVTELRVSIDFIKEEEWIKETCIPNVFICNKCKKKSLNLRTQDDHKTYDCPECQIDKCVNVLKDVGGKNGS